MNPIEPVAENVSARSPIDSEACALTEAQLVAFLDRELPPAQAATVEAHLAVCPDCAARRDALLATLRKADALPAPSEIDVVDAILDCIVGENTEAGAPPKAAFPPPPALSLETQILLDGMRALQAELAALCAEMADLRRDVSTLRGKGNAAPPRPAVADRFFPFAPPAAVPGRD